MLLVSTALLKMGASVARIPITALLQASKFTSTALTADPPGFSIRHRSDQTPEETKTHGWFVRRRAVL